MIILANGVSHTVNIQKNFSFTWKPAVKFARTYNGSTYKSDRGGNSDIYESSFSVVGDWSDLESLADDLRQDNNQIEITTEGEAIFGRGISYSSPIICNVINNSIPYPVRDITTTTLQLKVRRVSPVFWYTTSAPVPFAPKYNFSVDRVFAKNRNAWNSMQVQDKVLSPSEYGVTTHITSGITSGVAESVNISFELKDSELDANIYYLLQNRTFSQTWSTSELSLVFGTKSFVGYIDNLKQTQINAKNWRVNLTIIRGS